MMARPVDGRSLPDRIAAGIASVVQEGDSLLLAVSGGADSTAMLACLASVLPSKSCELSCIHIDHGLRSLEEADQEEAFVRSLCERYSLPLHVEHIPRGDLKEKARLGGDSLEALAREARHELLSARREALLQDRLSRPDSGRLWICLAHTKSDLYEGILLRVLRGSGPAGLGPLPLARPPLLRPLIDIERPQIESWLKDIGLSWCEDRSNRDLSFLRNRIRHRLVPLLDREFPFWKGGLLSFSETQDLIASESRRSMSVGPSWKASETGRALELELSDFLHLPLFLREELIFEGLDTACDLLFSPSGPSPLCVDRPLWPLKPVPRREVVRRFASSPKGTQLLGAFSLSCCGEKLSLEAVYEGPSRLSVTIREPGRYPVGCLFFEIVKSEGEQGVSIDLPCQISVWEKPLKEGEVAFLCDRVGRESSFVRISGKISVHPGSEPVHSMGAWVCRPIEGPE